MIQIKQKFQIVYDTQLDKRDIDFKVVLYDFVQPHN